MPTSTEEIKVLETFAKFEALQELLEEDISEESPSNTEFKNVAANHPAFKDLYLEIRVTQQKYKNRLVPAQVTETEFNDPGSLFKYNDIWLAELKQTFKRVNKAVIKFLDDCASPVDETKEEKISTALNEEITRLVNKISLECSHVTSTLDSTFQKLKNMTEINPSQSQVYANLQQQLIGVIDEKVPNLFHALSQIDGSHEQDSVKKANTEFTVFENKEKSRLYELIQLIAEKTVHSSPANTSTSIPKRESIHLKKVDPPSFSGQEVDYPDFYRKWNAIVGPAYLPDEAEIDRLRDALPVNVKDMLVGVTKMSKAWEILNKRFGDKDLIATKLKAELKSLSFSEKIDFERVIAIVIKVRSLVSRLETLEASQALKYDGEFVSAIYFQLPDRQKSKWLEFDKTSYEDKWSALSAFLEVAYEQAVQEKLLLASYDNSNNKKGNPSVGALAAGIDSSANQNFAKKDSDHQKLDQAKQRVGKCPLCEEEHTFKSKWRSMPWPSDRLIQCKRFNDMTTQQRGEFLEQVQGCSRCTSWGHTKPECTMAEIDCTETINGSRCHIDHSRLVCNSGVAYCMVARSTGYSNFEDIDELQPTLHYMQDICVNSSKTARVLWDDGSNRVLVNNDFAREQKLKSRDAVVTMKVVGHVKRMTVKLYEFALCDIDGNQYHIWGYGIDNIMEPDEPINLSKVRCLFPHVPDIAFKTLPRKRIDILMGLNYNSLHPCGGNGIDAVGNLKVLQSKFGCGWVIGGSHKDLRVSPLKFSSIAASARVARLSVIPHVDVQNIQCVASSVAKGSSTVNLNKVTIDPVLTPEFWESDGLGVLPPRKCNKCKQCAEKDECSESHYQLTLKEETELQLISDNVTIMDGQIHVSYPFVKDPSCLPNNRSAAVKVAARLWKSLEKDGLLEAYHEEVRKYIDRGTFVKLTEEELNSYEGPHQYISHHGVLKPSVSTPLRVVTNSSFNNHGNSLNSCLPKGPNSLNDMNKIMLRFRCYEKAFLYDLSKAYNTMRTGLVEKHLRRFVWKFDESDIWQDFGIDRVHFGDTPAACFLEVSKKKVAELGKDIDIEAAEKLIQDSYVDDGATGSSPAGVSRMVGNINSKGVYSGTISQILAQGGFVVKEFVILGDKEQSDENLLGNTVFGYNLDPKEEKLWVNFEMNLSKKKRNIRIEPNLSLANIESLQSITMTKRLLLGITNSFKDFLGMACPFTLCFKLAMKKLFELESPLSWDENIPVELRSSWISLISEASYSDRLFFPRSVRPHDAIGSPVLVGFGDGSFAAFAATVYVVWQFQCNHDYVCDGSGHFSSALLCANAKVTPLRGFTVPRSELSGGVLVSRLMLTATIALSKLEEKPSNAIILTDSTCTISCLEENAKRLKPFFHNRRSEILENMELIRRHCPLEEMHHVPGTLNPADIATRGDAKLEDIGPLSFWQTGPSFLSSPRSSWPITRNFCRVPVPDQEKRNPGAVVTASFRTVVVKKSENISNLHKTHSVLSNILEQNNSLNSRIRVVALVVRGWRIGKSEEILSAPLKPDELQFAERLILTHAMFDTAHAFNDGKLSSLLPERDGSLTVTRGRLGELGLQRVLGVSALPILVPSNRVAELYMWRAHCGYSGLFHRSPAQTLAKSRESVWIIKGKDLSKKICRNCMVCRRIRKDLAKQQMALLKEESLQVCPPWTNVSLDFAGPVVIKGEVNVRSRGKSWILIYVCRNTKAVCLLATSGYSTSDFLMKHEEFVARNNSPRHIVSDRGSQLVRAGMVLAEKEKPGNWNWNEVVRKNATTNWNFVPIGSQHRNGLSEAQVKILKRSLHLALPPGTVLKYSELITLLAKIAHSVNSRPLGIGSISQDSQQEDYLCPITPNHLLLGKSDDTALPLDYDDDDRLTARLAYVSSVYGTWWQSWHKQILPTLVPCSKWKQVHRNLERGDIVHMYYPGSLKDDYRIARVVDAFKDEKGNVR